MAERFIDTKGNIWEKVGSTKDGAVGACLAFLVIGIELAMAVYLLPGIAIMLFLDAIGVPQGWWCSALYAGVVYYVLYVKSEHVKRDAFFVVLASALTIATIYWLIPINDLESLMHFI